MTSRNGTARRTFIISSITLAFSVFSGTLVYIVNDVMTRLRFLESERMRIGLIAQGRGVQIADLKEENQSLRRKLLDVEVRLLILEARKP